MNLQEIRVVEVNTTAYKEENFSIITDLKEEEIFEVLYPIVMAERFEDVEYDNESLINSLIMFYPENFIKQVDKPVNKIII